MSSSSLSIDDDWYYIMKLVSKNTIFYHVLNNYNDTTLSRVIIAYGAT